MEIVPKIAHTATITANAIIPFEKSFAGFFVLFTYGENFSQPPTANTRIDNPVKNFMSNVGIIVFTDQSISNNGAFGIAGAAIDMLIGVVYGGVAAYFGGKTDAIMMRIVEILASIPYLLLVVLVSLIVGKGVGSLLIAMCLTGWCHMARLVRGQVLQLKDQEYLLAAKALGTPWYKVIFRHLIPNTLGVVIVAVTFDVPSFIFGEAFLSYIGLGVQAPMTSWGSLASNAQQTMAFYPYQLFFPAFFIALTMLSFQLLGDGLRDALDPKLRQ